MKKTAIAILIAVLVVAIGGGLLFAGLSAVNFRFVNLDRSEYMTNTYTFEAVRGLDIESQTADVELVAAQDGSCKVACLETDREKYTVTVRDGTLTIRPAQSKFRFMAFSFKSPKITVALPAGTYERLTASVGTGDITADRALAFDTMDIKLSTGDIALSGVQAQRVTARGSTGDIRLSDMAPETLTVTLSTGKIVLSNVVCAGDLRCESGRGRDKSDWKHQAYDEQ